MQKYGNVSFATVACAKCMRYGGRGGGTHTMGGGGGGGNTGHGTIYATMRLQNERISMHTLAFRNVCGAHLKNRAVV